MPGKFSDPVSNLEAMLFEKGYKGICSLKDGDFYMKNFTLGDCVYSWLNEHFEEAKSHEEAFVLSPVIPGRPELKCLFNISYQETGFVIEQMSIENLRTGSKKILTRPDYDSLPECRTLPLLLDKRAVKKNKGPRL